MKNKTNTKFVKVVGNVHYRFAGKWEFTAPGFQLRTPLRGGGQTAVRVAGIINGALKRTKGNGIDNLARANIAQMEQRAIAA